MNEELEYIELDNKKYGVIKEITKDNNKYVLLSNLDDVNDIIINKVIIEDNEEFLVGLDNKEEFDKISLLFFNSMR